MQLHQNLFQSTWVERTNLFVLLVLAWLTAIAPSFAKEDSRPSKSTSQPNVLFIAIDDLNDWVGWKPLGFSERVELGKGVG